MSHAVYIDPIAHGGIAIHMHRCRPFWYSAHCNLIWHSASIRHNGKKCPGAQEPQKMLGTAF
jgi:hypothetical protein